MSIWGGIVIAVVTAVSTIGLTELFRYLRDRAAERRLAAEWNITWLHRDTRLRGPRIAVLENIGHIEAHNVNITITGDSDFELHPDAPTDKCRPRDAILIMIDNVGTGVFKIEWTDAKGVAQGPVFRFPLTTNAPL